MMIDELNSYVSDLIQLLVSSNYSSIFCCIIALRFIDGNLI